MSKKICKHCQYENIEGAMFCKRCGTRLGTDMTIVAKSAGKHSVLIKSSESENIPFHMAHPEYHLRPISEFSKLFFWRNSPDYVEDPSETEVSDYLFIAKDGKLGILFWHFEKHWYGDTNNFHRVIQCEYDKIEKKDRMFVCYKGSERVFIDLKGNILK